MIKKVFYWGVLLLSLCLVTLSKADGLKVGVDQPEWRVTLMNSNQTLSSQDTKGHVVILHFWATWCEPCHREMPMLQSFAQAHKDQGVVLIAVSMDNIRHMAKIHEMAGHFNMENVAHFSQADIKSLGRIKRLPSTFIFDAQGVLLKNGHEGEAEMTQQELNQLVLPLLEGSKAVTNAH